MYAAIREIFLPVHFLYSPTTPNTNSALAIKKTPQSLIVKLTQLIPLFIPTRSSVWHAAR